MGHSKRNFSPPKVNADIMDHQKDAIQQQQQQQDQRKSPIIKRLANEVSLADLFDLFIEASTLRNVLAIHHRMLNYLDLNPCQFNIFFPTLKKAVLTNRVRKNWKAAAIFAKIDRRASHRCYQNNKSTTTTTNSTSSQQQQHAYDQQSLSDSTNHNIKTNHNELDNNNNNAMKGYNCLIIGSGPAGLRTAIELQLLGAQKTVIVEKRSRFSRNNVLHLWPFVIEDLKSLGAKKFYGKFCAGSIDHISIRQIQLILLKICLMIGCDFRDSCSFSNLCPASLINDDGTTNTCDFDTNDSKQKHENNNNNSSDDEGTKNNHVVLLETKASTVSASPVPLIDEHSDKEDISSAKKEVNDNEMEYDKYLDGSTLLDSSRQESSQLCGSHAHFECDFPLQEKELHQIKWDVIVGADGRRNTLKTYFPRKEFRGRLAIAITANFINSQTPAEAKIPEISGISYIYNQDLFKTLANDTDILLENICYYKDDTHYFVMTAQKRSLLERNVLLKDYATTYQLLNEDNINRKALLEYAKDAARWTTGLEPLNFALNHYGQEDCAMFDFTSMYAASNASKALQTKDGGLVLINLVGDSLLEPFWPTGSGCARGFLSSLDAAWMCRQWAVNKCSTMKPKNYSTEDIAKNAALKNNYNMKSVLSVIAERESIYRLLAQTTSENLHQNYSHWTLNPHTRYPNLNRHLVIPSQVKNLVGYHNGGSAFGDYNEDITKSLLNESSPNTTNSSPNHHRSRLISPNTLSKRSKKSKLQSNTSSSNNNSNKLSVSNHNRSQCRPTSCSSSRQASKSNKQQSILSPSPHRKHQANKHSPSKSNKSPSGYTDSLKEFELSYKNLTANIDSDDRNMTTTNCDDSPSSPLIDYEDIIRNYPMPISSLSGTTPSANNLVSLEARRARDIDECLRHRREQNSKGARREEILKRLQPTYGKRGSVNALIGAAAIYRDMMRASKENANSSDDVSGGGGSIRRCASFAERVKSFENKLSESYGLSGSPTTAKDKTNDYIDDIKNLPQFATLQEMFVTNSTLNNDKDSTVKKKSHMPIMKLSKDDWNVKCWEERLAKYHNKQMLYGECGIGSHSSAANQQQQQNNNTKSKSPIRSPGGSDNVFVNGLRITRPEKQVEVFKGRIKEMADKLKRPCETKSQVYRYDYLLGSSTTPLTQNSTGNSHGASQSSRSHEWVNLIKNELTSNNKKNDDNSNNSPAYSSCRKRVIKKLFEDDDEDDVNQNEHQHYDHLCLNKPKNKYLPVNNYTSCLSRVPKDTTPPLQQHRSNGGKTNSYASYKVDAVETNQALAQSSSINSNDKMKPTTTTNTIRTSSSIGTSSSSASSTISELSSNSSIKGNHDDRPLMNSNNNNNRLNHASNSSNNMCIRCKSSVATIDKVVIGSTIVHRSCLTCSKCDIRLRLDEVKARLTIANNNNNNNNNSKNGNSKHQQSSDDLMSSTQQVDKQLLDTAMKTIQLDDPTSTVFICVICQSSLRHMQPSMQAGLKMESSSIGKSTNNTNDICHGTDQSLVNNDLGQRMKQRVKSREEFLNQQVDYSTLYKSILDDTVHLNAVNANNNPIKISATCIQDEENSGLVTINDDSIDHANAISNQITSSKNESCKSLTSDEILVKEKDDIRGNSSSNSSHTGNERVSSGEDQSEKSSDIKERVEFELSSRRLVDEDELEKMLHLNGNSFKNEDEDEEPSISSADGSTSGTTSDLKSISSSNYDNDNSDDGADLGDEEVSSTADDELKSSISSPDVSSRADDEDDAAAAAADLDDASIDDNNVEKTSLNSPPNTDAYEDEDDDDDDDADRNSTYNDFLTSEEFDYSVNVSKIHASPKHHQNHNNNHHDDNTGATNSINSTPSRILRSNISSETELKGSPKKQVLPPPPEIVINYQEGEDTATTTPTTIDVSSPIDNETVEKDQDR